MGAEGFEPPKAMPFDLQSNLVDHLSTLPNWFGRIRTFNRSVNSGLHYRCATNQKADKEGFEPSEDISAFSDLANRRIRPLCHLSNTVILTGFEPVFSP